LPAEKTAILRPLGKNLAMAVLASETNGVRSSEKNDERIFPAIHDAFDPAPVFRMNDARLAPFRLADLEEFD
jgi:hypothetical protein